MVTLNYDRAIHFYLLTMIKGTYASPTFSARVIVRLIKLVSHLLIVLCCQTNHLYLDQAFSFHFVSMDRINHVCITISNSNSNSNQKRTWNEIIIQSLFKSQIKHAKSIYAELENAQFTHMRTLHKVSALLFQLLQN